MKRPNERRRGTSARRASQVEPGAIVVVGGAGAMGRITVRDLVETAPPDVPIVIADRDARAARCLAAALRGRRRGVVALPIDVVDIETTARRIAGAFGVVNAVQHSMNLFVMEAAIRAGAHYCDLGGLFHMTRRQLELDTRFRRAGLLAILGMGAAPGVVNMMARAAADDMARVDEIHIAVGGVDRTPGRGASVLGASYSMDTILDEASLPAALFTAGRLRFVEPLSGDAPVSFPPPVGSQRPARTLHSEVATLPLTYKRKGIREVSFRIAFPPPLAERLRFLRDLGMLSSEALAVGGAAVSPRQVLKALLARLPTPAAGGPPAEYEVLRVVVRGKLDRRNVEEVIDCHVRGIPEWGVGADADTGCPPSIALQLLARGVIEARGVLPPERAVPVEPFFRELARRGMRVTRRRSSIGRGPGIVAARMNR